MLLQFACQQLSSSKRNKQFAQFALFAAK